MPIENRDLPVGTRLEANYKKVRYVCTVEAGEDGKVAFVLEDGQRFTASRQPRRRSSRARRTDGASGRS